MNQPLVLVDTSVWVEFFNRPSGNHHGAVSELLDEDRVAVIGVVAAELLRGCRSVDDREEVEAALHGVHRLEVSFSHWSGVGREMFELRRRGVTVSLSDAAVAFSAREAGCLLYTLDADFEHFSGIARYR